MNRTRRWAGGQAGGECLVMMVAILLSFAAPAVAQYPEEPPPPMPLEPMQFPPFQEAKLRNGLTLVVVENRRLPVVSISLSIPAGSRYDARGHEGLASLTAELITKGTTSRTAEQIAEQIESVGASLNAAAGDDFFELSTTVLTEHLQLGFELVADVLLNATYPEEELEIARTRTLSALRLQKTQPGALAVQFFANALYGDHPYGRYATEASVQAIDQDAVRRFAATYLKPRTAVLVMAGDIGMSDARRLADRFLGSWRGTAPAPPAPAPPPRRPSEIILVHRPGSEQSNIRLGNLAFEPGADIQFPALVANKILGGGTDARLFMILRETKSWTYGAYSSVIRRGDVGYFRATAEVRNAVTDSALVEILTQLGRLRTEQVPDSELVAAKGFLVGSFPLDVQTPQQIADQVATVKLYGLGEDYLRTYRQRLDRVTARDVQRAAQRLTHPDSLVIVVVGDGKAVYDKLAPVAPVRIIDVDGNPLTVDDLDPAPSVVTLDPAHLVARRDSFQMTFQGNPIGGLVRETKRDGARWVIRDVFAIPMAGMQQEGTITLDASSLEVLTRTEHGQVQGQTVAIDLTYADGRVSGSATIPQPGGTPKEIAVDTALAAGTFDSEALEALLPALPLAEGAVLTVNAFAAESGSVQPTTIRVAGIEQVTVPAGTFTTFRVEMQSGQEASTVFVTTDTPRRIVKMEVIGQPIALELVK